MRAYADFTDDDIRCSSSKVYCGATHLVQGVRQVLGCGWRMWEVKMTSYVTGRVPIVLDNRDPANCARPQVRSHHDRSLLGHPPPHWHCSNVCLSQNPLARSLSHRIAVVFCHHRCFPSRTASHPALVCPCHPLVYACIGVQLPFPSPASPSSHDAMVRICIQLLQVHR